MARCNTGTQLAREIHEEFLVCKICLESYKTPKCLSCLHTFCEQCIDGQMSTETAYRSKYTDYRKFVCPLCSKTTQLPVGGARRLTDNFLVTNLSEMIRRQRPSKFPFCDLCKVLGGKHREALSKCLDCDKLLCGNCVAAHRLTRVTQNHSLFDVEIEKEIECKEHEGEVIRFYCRMCETCICILCTFQCHQNHDITNFKDAAVQYKEDIVEMLGKCHERISCLETHVDSLVNCEQVVRDVEQQIRDTAIELIRDVRSKEHQLIEDLHTIYGSECLEFVESRKELTSQLENLRSTCSLTDLVLNGKDIELLLLKNDVQEKLTAITAVEVKPLPTTIQKNVHFKADRYIDFGTIQDLDSVVSSNNIKIRNGVCGSSGERSVSSEKETKRSNRCTQTESKTTTEAAVQTGAGVRKFTINPKESSQFSKPAKYF